MRGLGLGCLGFRGITPIIKENLMEKNTKNEMEARVIQRLYRVTVDTYDDA